MISLAVMNLLGNLFLGQTAAHLLQIGRRSHFSLKICTVAGDAIGFINRTVSAEASRPEEDFPQADKDNASIMDVRE